MLKRELHLKFVDENLYGFHLNERDFVDMMLAVEKMHSVEILSQLEKEDLIDIIHVLLSRVMAAQA